MVHADGIKALADEVFQIVNGAKDQLEPFDNSDGIFDMQALQELTQRILDAECLRLVLACLREQGRAVRCRAEEDSKERVQVYRFNFAASNSNAIFVAQPGDYRCCLASFFQVLRPNVALFVFHASYLLGIVSVCSSAPLQNFKCVRGNLRRCATLRGQTLSNSSVKKSNRFRFC